MKVYKNPSWNKLPKSLTKLKNIQKDEAQYNTKIDIEQIKINQFLSNFELQILKLNKRINDLENEKEVRKDEIKH